MNQDSKPTKAEVNQLLHNIYTLYDDKIRGSSASRSQTFVSSSNTSCHHLFFHSLYIEDIYMLLQVHFHLHF